MAKNNNGRDLVELVNEGGCLYDRTYGNPNKKEVPVTAVPIESPIIVEIPKRYWMRIGHLSMDDGAGGRSYINTLFDELKVKIPPRANAFLSTTHSVHACDGNKHEYCVKPVQFYRILK